MLKQKLVYEVEKHEKKFSLEIPEGTSYGELYDVGAEIVAWSLNLISEQNKKQVIKQEEIPVEESKES